MTGVEIATLVIGIILLVLAAALIALVLMQQGKDKKLSGAIAGGSDTFYGKSKAASKDKILSTVTMIASIVFVVLVVAMYILVQFPAK
jgi:preprotein translocase subunit SecG